VQQSLVALFVDISISELIVYAFVITLMLSIISWNFIEKRALRMKDNYQFIEKIFAKSKRG
jgi:peptidoglycan/LPS O-acetylase OafA/YrhL